MFRVNVRNYTEPVEINVNEAVDEAVGAREQGAYGARVKSVARQMLY